MIKAVQIPSSIQLQKTVKWHYLTREYSIIESAHGSESPDFERALSRFNDMKEMSDLIPKLLPLLQF